MKMVSATLKMLKLRVHITVSVMTMALMWMKHGDWFYMTGYGVFGHEVKATKKFSPDNLTRWIITQFKLYKKEH